MAQLYVYTLLGNRKLCTPECYTTFFDRSHKRQCGRNSEEVAVGKYATIQNE